MYVKVKKKNRNPVWLTLVVTGGRQTQHAHRTKVGVITRERRKWRKKKKMSIKEGDETHVYKHTHTTLTIPIEHTILYIQVVDRYSVCVSTC